VDEELLIFDALDDGVVTEVIRPAAIVPETSARAILFEMAMRDVRAGGLWHAQPTLWRRYDRPWEGQQPGPSHLLGTLQVAYGTPTRYAITIYRVTITTEGSQEGFHVTSLTDEALGFGDLTLSSCPRAQLQAPPPRFPHH
jgi:hypothetical protein